MEIKDWTWFNVLVVDVCSITGKPIFLAEPPKENSGLKVTTQTLDSAVTFRNNEDSEVIQTWIKCIKKHSPNLNPKVVYVRCDSIYTIDENEL